MITQVKKSLEEVVNAIPKGAVTLDVGAASAPIRRADFIIDAVPFADMHLEQAKGPGESRFSKERYVQHDICDRKPWPFADKQFDYSFCSHVLEDIRDPVWVCSELIRVSKAGYIEIPSRLYETTFGIEAGGLAGAAHHRWLVDLADGKLRFTFKYFQVHKKAVNKNRRAPGSTDEDQFLKIEWKDSFEYGENWLNSGKEIFEYYLERPVSEKEKWQLYRALSPRPLLIRWLQYAKNVSPALAERYEQYRASIARTVT